VSVGNGPVVDWVIESVPRPEGDANRPSLFVHMVLADGVLQRVSELQRTGSWHNYNLWASECSTAAGPPARITVRARNLTLKLSGRADGCRVRIAGGALTTEVDLYRTAYDDIWVDLPEVPPTRLGHGAAAVSSRHGCSSISHCCTPCTGHRFPLRRMVTRPATSTPSSNTWSTASQRTSRPATR
jgi:hypothetical protein